MKYTFKQLERFTQLAEQLSKGDDGFTLIGDGAFRDVYSHRRAPGVVFKIGYSAVYGNANEWATWKICRSTPLSKLLVPVIMHHSGVLVQPRVTKVGTIDEEHPAYDQIRNKLGKYIHDLHPWNIGKYAGRYKVLDYGCFNLATWNSETREEKRRRLKLF